MPARGREFRLRDPPADLDELAGWFGWLSERLVLLEEFPLEDVGFAIERFEEGLAEHLRSARAGPAGGPASGPKRVELAAVLRDDHARFLVSLEQLRWFYRIVQAEDHGGHRQALGQYGKVLAEALEAHRGDERRFLERTRAPSLAPRGDLVKKP